MEKATNSNPRVVLYCRVATQSQLDDFAMENQSAHLREQAERKRLEVAGEVRAYEKGVSLHRPGWDAALRMASEKQAGAILVKDLDRVARGFGPMQKVISDLDKHGLGLETCDGAVSFTPELGLSMFNRIRK